MAQAKLEVIIALKDMASKRMRSMFGGMQGASKRFADNWKKHWLRNAAMITAAILVMRKLITTIKEVGADLISVANKVEQFGVRLKVVLGGVEEGNQVFKDMTELAGRVPKTYDEIMEAATNMAAVVKGGAAEVKALMPIIVDISAATGLSVQETTGQIIRMYSAGAAAADMFRERGISMALGFQAGVSYTNEETMNILTSQWENATGKYVGASKELAKTFTGQVSMMQDAWFIFRRDVGIDMFENLKADMAAVLELIEQSKVEGGEYNDTVKSLGTSFNSAYNSAKDFVAMVVVGLGQSVDIFNDLNYHMQRYVNLNEMAAIGFQKLALAGSPVLKVNEGLRIAAEQALADMEATLAEGLEKEAALQIKATKDYSKELKERVELYKVALAQMRDMNMSVNAKNKEDSETVTEDTEKENMKIQDITKKTGDKMTDSIGGAFSDMMFQGKDFASSMMSNFQRMASSFIAQVSAMIVKWGILMALTGGTGKAGTGFLGGLAKIFMHSGGMVKKAHSGMLARDEVPIVAQTGEAIISRRGVANMGGEGAVNRLNSGIGGAGGGGGVTVHIENASFNNEDQIQDVFARLSALLAEKSRS